MRVLTWRDGRWRAEERRDGRWRLYELGALRLDRATMFVHPVDDLDRDGH